MAITKLREGLALCFRPFPALQTQRLKLRQLTLDDVQEIFLLRSNPQVLQYLDRHPATSLDEAVNFIQQVTKNEEAGDSVTWALCFPEEQKLIGTIAFWRLQKEHFRAEIGYALSPEHQGKGLMTEAFKEVISYGFGPMGLHSIEANVNPANDASIRLLKKAGFVQEGYFKENFYFDGKFTDSAIFSLLNK